MSAACVLAAAVMVFAGEARAGRLDRVSDRATKSPARREPVGAQERFTPPWTHP
jgi:hypothetical protein